MSFLFFLFVIFFVLPWLGQLWLKYRLRKGAKQWADAMNAARGGDPQADGTKPRRSGWSDPPVHQKKIGKDVGEYVKYEEISTTRTTDTATGATAESTTYTSTESYTATESQVTDADWEEV